jgi:hypothetical protein
MNDGSAKLGGQSIINAPQQEAKQEKLPQKNHWV